MSGVEELESRSCGRHLRPIASIDALARDWLHAKRETTPPFSDIDAFTVPGYVSDPFVESMPSPSSNRATPTRPQRER